ncbi:MAG TPA: SRPBCC family protein [Candidatus Sulfotelmatobacter sp.]|nr:SRPBCC family protein [Candidatus Sulfotelmatobacter sp.]
MIIDDSFDVDAPVDKVWPLLKDVTKVASCIPNAKITDVVDDKTYKATVKVKAGPVAVDYGATIYVEEFDEATHTARLRVQGNESRGRGGVKASVVSQATDTGGKTHVTLHTDAQISGIVATVGGRLIEGVAKKTVAEFAANLAKLL